MSKTTRVLQLINLLVSRDTVTIENIETTCGIPERTIYRYLNWISEANIPVYYDKAAHGYRLARSRRVNFDDLSLHQAVILVTALKAVLAHVDSGYREDIDDILSKVIVRLTVPIEEIIPSEGANAPVLRRDPDYSALFTTALLSVAIAKGNRIKLAIHADNGDIVAREIANPRLKFDGDWEVSAGKDTRTAASRLTDVAKVTIL
jgi:predicted DNA-binding transcriptional regulator YafY